MKNTPPLKNIHILVFRCHLFVVCLLSGFAGPALSEEIQTVVVNEKHKGWSIEPFRHGYGVLEREYGTSTYDTTSVAIESARFPIDRLAGTVRIPVFLIDWSDYDPAKDLSNKANPRSKNPDYKSSSVEKFQAHLNSDNGPAGYYKAASGGQLIVHFDVFPWISSNKSKYLKDKEPFYYRYEKSRARWIASKKPLALDVLRAAIAEKGFDPRKYDADQNKIIDGFIIAYEGSAAKLAGKNMSNLGPVQGAMGNFKQLFPSSDPHFERTKNMDILYGRYVNLPEDSLLKLRTVTHETGHLLLGYKDYYYSGAKGELVCDLGNYAMSARGANFSPAAMEKWLYGKWLTPQIKTNGKLALDNHHLKVGEAYSAKKTYLHQVFVDNDPLHYFLIENRFFDPAKRHFDQRHSSSSKSKHPESGLVIFEVNEHQANRGKWRKSSIARHFPEPTLITSSDDRILYKDRTFQRGEEFLWTSGEFKIHISNISTNGEVMTYSLLTSHKDTESPTAPN